MLPVPSTAYRSKPRGSQSYFVSGSSTLPNSVFERLRTRARLTNLAVGLILSALSISVVLNLRHWRADRLGVPTSLDPNARFSSPTRPTSVGSIENTIDRTAEMASLTHLVMVAGHAIWKGSDPDRRGNDSDWVLTPIQRGGSVNTFYKHIEAGVNEVNSDPKSLLVFSGGQTRIDTPPSTESQSYLRLAIESSLLPPTSEFPRATTEEYALDSLTNLMFSYARFHEVTGNWPTRVTVIGYEMKRPRFEKLHRAAMRIPSQDFRYIGIDDEGDTSASYEGESIYGYQPFSEDLYGCFPPLSLKKTSRNPFARYHPYHSSSPEIADLLEWCPVHRAHAQGPEGQKGGGVFPHALPWKTTEPTEISWSREQD